MIKRLIAILLCLLIASPAWAAITAVGAIGTANSTAAGTTLVITTSATLEAGNVALVAISKDNDGTTDADHDEITSVVDSASNTYAKVCEFTYGATAINAGATASLYMTRATSELATSGTITITLDASKPSKAAVAFEFTVGAALELVGTCQTGGGGSVDPPSLTISGLSSAETLFFRVHAEENRLGTDFTTLTTNYTSAGNATADSGSGSTSMQVKTEYRILTGTGDTSNPADDSDGDSMSVFVALREVAAATVIPTQPIFFQ